VTGQAGARASATEAAEAAAALDLVLAGAALGPLRRFLPGGAGVRFADAEAIYSYEGTREMNTLIVGRAITGLSAFV
jgi:alkylation response protein AidB-like acyl-CoA dehydrogenase